MYQALYRVYRPKKFSELLDQTHITQTLSNQIITDNISHAYLFSGTKGTGKTSCAKIFARAINCINLQDGEPCNECKACVGILDETNMDVMEMDAASNNGVDNIRELRDKAIYPPSLLKYKVYIIDEVHMLSKGAFNALLKVLEEPPKHLIFILATTEPEKIPQTILSRLQRYDFKRISHKSIVYNMEEIVKKENIKIEKEVLHIIARHADGAMRDALSLLDQCTSVPDEFITVEIATDILGFTGYQLMKELLDAVYDRNLEEIFNQINEIIARGKDLNQLLNDLLYEFRNTMIAKTVKNSKEILETENISRYIEMAEKMSLDNIIKAIEILQEAFDKIRYSSQPRILVEMAMIKLFRLDSELKEVESIISTMKQEKKLSDNNVVEFKIEEKKEKLADIKEEKILEQEEKVSETLVEKEEAKPKKELETDIFVAVEENNLENNIEIPFLDEKYSKNSSAEKSATEEIAENIESLENTTNAEDSEMYENLGFLSQANEMEETKIENLDEQIDIAKEQYNEDTELNSTEEIADETPQREEVEASNLELNIEGSDLEKFDDFKKFVLEKSIMTGTQLNKGIKALYINGKVRIYFDYSDGITYKLINVPTKRDEVKNFIEEFYKEKMELEFELLSDPDLEKSKIILEELEQIKLTFGEDIVTIK